MEPKGLGNSPVVQTEKWGLPQQREEEKSQSTLAESALQAVRDGNVQSEEQSTGTYGRTPGEEGGGREVG